MQMMKHAIEGIHPGFETPAMKQKVQNKGISGPTKRTDVLQKFFKKKSVGVCLFMEKYQEMCAKVEIISGKCSILVAAFEFLFPFSIKLMSV